MNVLAVSVSPESQNTFTVVGVMWQMVGNQVHSSSALLPGFLGLGPLCYSRKLISAAATRLCSGQRAAFLGADAASSPLPLYWSISRGLYPDSPTASVLVGAVDSAVVAGIHAYGHCPRASSVLPPVCVPAGATFRWTYVWICQVCQCVEQRNHCWVIDT